MLSEHPEIFYNISTIQLYNLINKRTYTQIRKQEYIKYAAKIKKVGGRIKLFTAFAESETRETLRNIHHFDKKNNITKTRYT